MVKPGVNSTLYKAWETLASGPAVDECRDMIRRNLNEKRKLSDDVDTIPNPEGPAASKGKKCLFDDDSEDDEAGPPPTATTGRDPLEELHKIYEELGEESD